MVKVFISHQKADSAAAARVASRLKIHHSIESYLDIIDPGIARGEDLADHIRRELTKCSQLLAVVSEATQLSWWVPWEIGVASEKLYPLATFTSGATQLPEYLRKWPYLSSDADVDRYAEASKAADRTYVRKRGDFTSEPVSREAAYTDFFTTLRASLGQNR